MHNLRTDWCDMTEPDERFNGRSLQWPCGKVLGRSSSINGLPYLRGQAADHDRWAESGNRVWAFDDVLPAFKRSEDQERGADEYHGTGGPLQKLGAPLVHDPSGVGQNLQDRLQVRLVFDKFR